MNKNTQLHTHSNTFLPISTLANTQQTNKSSDRSMEVLLPARLGNHVRTTDQPTDGQTGS